jgi:DNA-binding FrmR family transcriptional regulator
MTPLVKKLLAQIDALREALQRANGEIQQIHEECVIAPATAVPPNCAAACCTSTTTAM